MAGSVERVETVDGQTTGALSADIGADTLSHSLPYDSPDLLPHVGTRFRELGGPATRSAEHSRPLLRVLSSVFTSRFTRHHESDSPAA